MNLKEKIQSEVFLAVSKAADEMGVEAYVVGGYVRDLILERPSKDVDFVCVGSGISLAQATAKIMGSEIKVKVFKNFGTAMFKVGFEEYEFVGARRESYRRDSRKPIVEDGTLEDDQNRRDFTINALAISLSSQTYGELVDPFGGVEHLKQKLIKTPLNPSITFSDDPLRMMRAVRFAAQLGFDIDGDTYEALVNNKERLDIISKERITTELNKIILSSVPSYGFKILFNTGLLGEFFPEMVALHGVEFIEGKGHKDNFYHTLQVLDNICAVTNDLWLRWAAIMHDIAKPPTKRFHNKSGWTFHGHEEKGARMVPIIFRRLTLPMGVHMKYVQKLVRLHLRPIALVKSEVTDSAIRRVLFEAGDDVEDLMKLCRADITSKNDNKVQKYLRNFDFVESKMKEVEERDQIRNFQPVITGQFIMDKYGLAPCREVGDLKDALKEAVLQGDVNNTMEDSEVYLEKIAKDKFNIEPIKR